MNSELGSAVEVFVKAITKIKSYYRPHLCERMGSLYVMRDPPGRRYPRKTEIVVVEQDPENVLEEVRRAGLGWHYLCDMRPNESDFQEIRSRYKKLGYRALTTEWMFLHDLCDIPQFSSDPPVRRVESQEQADGIHQIAQHKLRLVPDTRDFMIWDSQRDYGRARSVDIGNSAWVQGLYVYPEVRRKGYGKALMSALLQSDVSLGQERSVLLASTVGATVYPLLGYRQIGILQMFCPTRESI